MSAHVQSEGISSGDSAVDSISLTLDVAVTADNLLVVVGCFKDTGSSVTPTGSTNTFVPVTGSPADAPDGLCSVTMHYDLSAAGGSYAITYNPDTGSDWMSFAVAEYSGLESTSQPHALDVETGTGTAVATANIVTTEASVLVGVMARSENTGDITPGGDDTQRYEALNFQNSLNFQDRVGIAAGTYVSDWTQANSTGWAAIGAAFREVADAGGAGGIYLLESSAVDGYQLEDGSGVYLIEAAEASGSLSVTLGAATLTATATAPVSSSLAVTLGAATLAGTAVAPVSASLASTLGAVTLSASGTVEEAGAVTGTLAATLGAATLVASAVAPVSSSLAVALGAVTLAGSAAATISSSLAYTLGAVTLVANAVAPVAASLSSTLGTATLAGTAVAPISASLVGTLGTATLSASGTNQDPGIFGIFVATLGEASLVASAVASASASLSITLGEAVLAASAAAPVTGSLVVALDAATAIAYATSPAIIPETPFPLTQEQTFLLGPRQVPSLPPWAFGRRRR